MLAYVMLTMYADYICWYVVLRTGQCGNLIPYGFVCGPCAREMECYRCHRWLNKRNFVQNDDICNACLRKEVQVGGGAVRSLETFAVHDLPPASAAASIPEYLRDVRHRIRDIISQEFTQRRLIYIFTLVIFYWILYVPSSLWQGVLGQYI